jgi:hypothetical protein
MAGRLAWISGEGKASGNGWGGQRVHPVATRTRPMADQKGKGSAAAKSANAKAEKEGEKNPRKSSAAQAELGKKGGKKSGK